MKNGNILMLFKELNRNDKTRGKARLKCIFFPDLFAEMESTQSFFAFLYKCSFNLILFHEPAPTHKHNYLKVSTCTYTYSYLYLPLLICTLTYKYSYL